MFHPWGRVEGTFEEMLDSHLGPQGSCVLSHEFYETDQQRGFLRGTRFKWLEGNLRSILQNGDIKEVQFHGNSTS